MYIRFQFLGSGALYLGFETCLKCIVGQVCSYSRHKHKLLILSRLSDLVRCIVGFNFLGSGALYLRFKTCLKCTVGQVCSYSRHKHKLLILSRLSDFMTCSSRLIFRVRGPYLCFGIL